MKSFLNIGVLFLFLASCDNYSTSTIQQAILSGTAYTVGGEMGGDTVTVRLEDVGSDCILRHITHVNGTELAFELDQAQFATALNGTGGWDYQDRENTPITIVGESCQDWVDYVAGLGGGNADLDCGEYRIAGPQDALTFRNIELSGLCGP